MYISTCKQLGSTLKIGMWSANLHGTFGTADPGARCFELTFDPDSLYWASVLDCYEYDRPCADSWPSWRISHLHNYHGMESLAIGACSAACCCWLRGPTTLGGYNVSSSERGAASKFVEKPGKASTRR
jgi:hypothetical protein